MLGVFFKNHREVDHSKIRLPRVLIKMKRKIDLVEEEHESEDEEKESSSEERKDEEPRIKDGHLSQAVSEKRASELLHIMAASKDILFWAPREQLLQNKGIIPVTNIAELVEYVILPHNDNFTKSRALNTFLNGGFNHIKNKKLPSDLLENWRKKATEMQKILPRTRAIMRRVQRILKIRRRWRRKKKRKWLLRMALKLKTSKRATTTPKMTVRKQKVVALKRPPPFTMKILVNNAKTPECVRDIDHEMS